MHDNFSGMAKSYTGNHCDLETLIVSKSSSFQVNKGDLMSLRFAWESCALSKSSCIGKSK